MTANQKSAARIVTLKKISIGVTAILLWLVTTVIVINHTGSVIVDGFQSMGAVAGAKAPGQLAWPMLGSFMGYDQVWGFHWFGWPFLRSLLLPIMPWNPQTEIVFLSIIWLFTAYLCYHFMGPTGTHEKNGFCAVLVLLTPGFLIAAQSYRPEIITALLLTLLMISWEANHKGKLLLTGITLVFLPTVHPLGFVVPISWLFLSLLHRLKNKGSPHETRIFLFRWFCFCLGIAFFGAWYVMQPLAWAQFQLNIACQKELTEGLGTGWLTFFTWGFYGKSGLILLFALVPALLQAIVLFYTDAKRLLGTGKSPMNLGTLAAVGLLASIGFNVATKNPNTLHFVAIAPIISFLFAGLVDRWFSRRKAYWKYTAIAFSLIIFSLFPLKQAIVIVRNSGKSYRDELSIALQQLLPSRKVLIPVAFWEAALLRKNTCATQYQFSTFPNILTRPEREIYEQQLLDDLQTGDLLVWDPQQEAGGIFNFVEKTALRHALLHPEEDPAHWEKITSIHLPVNYSMSQSVEFPVYQRR